MFSRLRQLLGATAPLPSAAVPAGERVYAIGDIHGRADLFQAMIDAIEKGVRKDKDIIYPQEAKLLYLWRALLPKLWWKTVMNFEK